MVISNTRVIYNFLFIYIYINKSFNVHSLGLWMNMVLNMSSKRCRQFANKGTTYKIFKNVSAPTNYFHTMAYKTTHEQAQARNESRLTEVCT